MKRPLCDIPEVAIWTHRWSPFIGKCAASVARHTRGSYSLLVVCEPGTCHENMNRVLARSRSRYVVFLDEDVEILTHGWLDRLVRDLAQDERLGAVGCAEVKDGFARALYLNGARRAQGGLVERTWIPAYVMAFDRVRYPLLRFDERIPGDKGMTDVDACLQLRRHGFKVACDRRVVVYHPHKTPAQRGKDGVPTQEDELAWFSAQRAYMTEKWGSLYTDDMTLNPKP